MRETTFKYVRFGHDFEVGGITYTKTNHMRGIYKDKDNNQLYRRFNKRSRVSAKSNFYDLDINGGSHVAV